VCGPAAVGNSAIATTKASAQPWAGLFIGRHVPRPPFLPIFGRNYLITGAARSAGRKLIQTGADPRTQEAGTRFSGKTFQKFGATATRLPGLVAMAVLNRGKTVWIQPPNSKAAQLNASITQSP
jgi:hypothetical protein